MKILLLFGILATLNVLILRLIHAGKRRQREAEKVERLAAENEYAEFLREYKSFDHAAEEAKWRIR